MKSILSKKIGAIAFPEDEKLTTSQRQERRVGQLNLNMNYSQAVWALPNRLVCHTKNSILCGCIVSGIIPGVTDEVIPRYDPMIINTLNREIEALPPVDSPRQFVMSDLSIRAYEYLTILIWRTVTWVDSDGPQGVSLN